MASSDSSSEDENLKNLREAVDTELIDDSFFNEFVETKTKQKTPKEAPKSQRHLEEEDDTFKSDLNTSKSMQEFIAKKLSKLIENQVEYVDIKNKKKSKDSDVDQIKLLKDSTSFVKLIDPDEKEFLEQRKKVPIEKRKLEEDESSDREKLKSVAINLDQIQEETKCWSTRTKKQKLFEYKNIKSIGYLRELPNEFIKLRNKNNWTESKISQAKYFGKGIGSVCNKDSD